MDYIDPENISKESQKVLDAIESFTRKYNPRLYSTAYFLDQLAAPLQIHQGGTDAWVPVEWQRRFVKKLKNLNKKVDYYYYPASDHNLKTDWDTVIERDLEFFKSFLD